MQTLRTAIRWKFGTHIKQRSIMLRCFRKAQPPRIGGFASNMMLPGCIPALSRALQMLESNRLGSDPSSSISLFPVRMHLLGWPGFLVRRSSSHAPTGVAWLLSTTKVRFLPWAFLMGAVLYCRVSSEGQIERNVANLPTQEKKCREHCKRSKLTVLKVFVDAGESARTADRPQLHALLDYCRDHKGKVSHVIVADLSRLARNVGDQNLITSRLNNLGILLQSVDEPHAADHTATGKLTSNMLGSLNQYYSDVLSERVRYRMREAVKSPRVSVSAAKVWNRTSCSFWR